jgi:DNA-binding response OmpR family regulator
MQRILVIDDDVALTSTLQRGLAYEGFTVEAANSGRRGLTLAHERVPDLVILDVMMPDLDGFEVLARLRSADAELPVLMLTARDDAEHQVKGLECGADDYVVKPFTFAVLAARVKALLRRQTADRAELLHFADLILDTALRCAHRGSREVELTWTEYEVLRQFLLHPRRILSKSFLMDRVWGYDVEGESNVLEVYVKQLRQKLESGGEPRLIHTSRGAGYALREMAAVLA